MRRRFAGLGLLLVALALAACLGTGRTEAGGGPLKSGQAEAGAYNYTVRVYLFDYLTLRPLNGTRLTLRMSPGAGATDIVETLVTNASGAYTRSWQREGKIDSLTLREMTVNENLTVIRVGSSYLEPSANDSRYVYSESERRPYVQYSITEGVDAWTEVGEGRTEFVFLIWAVPGKLVAVPDIDPLLGQRRPLLISPSVPSNYTEVLEEIPGSVSPRPEQPAQGPRYLVARRYLLPIGYPVGISSTTGRYPTFTVTVDENTTLVNWPLLAARNYSLRQVEPLEEEVRWMTTFGIPVTRGYEGSARARFVFGQALTLFENGSYRLGAELMRSAERQLDGLRHELGSIRSRSVLTTLALLAFGYGFSFLLSAVVLGKKLRWAFRLSVFFAIIVVFLFTQPYVKLALSLFLSRVFPSPLVTPYMDAPSLLLSAFLCGSISLLILIALNFTLQLFRAPSFANFIVGLGIDNIRARRVRSALTIITISIIIGAAVTFVNITSGSSIVETGRREVTEPPVPHSGVIIEPKYASPIEDFAVEWVRSQDWCRELGVMKGPGLNESILEQWETVDVELTYSVSTQSCAAVGVDPSFMAGVYDLNLYVLPGGAYFPEKDSVLISNDFTGVPGIPVNAPVTLNIIGYTEEEAEVTLETMSFTVSGMFDPDQLAGIKGIDGEPLFEDTSYLVLFPENATAGYFETSSVTALTEEGTDLGELARQLVFTLGKRVTVHDAAAGVVFSLEELFLLSVTGFSTQVVPLAITVSIVFSAMTSVVIERKRDISVLATVGSSPGSILQIFVTESLMIGLLSAFIGYFGSYLLALAIRAAGLQLSTTIHWSFSSVLVAFLTGTVVTLLGSVIPCARAQKVGLFGREKRRDLSVDMRVAGETTEYALPMKVTTMEGETLYLYLKEALQKEGKTVPVSQELFQDGTFTFAMEFLDPNRPGFKLPVTLSGLAREGSICPVVTLPTEHKGLRAIVNFLYTLEKLIVRYSSWKEKYFRVVITREAPGGVKVRTLDDILSDIRALQGQIQENQERLRRLESLRTRLSGTVYTEFEEKYTAENERLFKELRPLGLELEPFYKVITEQIRGLNLQLERTTAAHQLGEITDEQHRRETEPLQTQTADLQQKIDEMDQIYTQLKMPRPTRGRM